MNSWQKTNECGHSYGPRDSDIVFNSWPPWCEGGYASGSATGLHGSARLAVRSFSEKNYKKNDISVTFMCYARTRETIRRLDCMWFTRTVFKCILKSVFGMASSLEGGAFFIALSLVYKRFPTRSSVPDTQFLRTNPRTLHLLTSQPPTL